MADLAKSDELISASEEPPSTKKILMEFCGYTTTHGVGRLAEAKTCVSRLIWALLIFGAFAIFVFETHALFEVYFSRPVSTVMNLRQATVSKALCIHNTNNIMVIIK